MVFTDFDSVKPDLALIDKKYRKWWVVEIELSIHSLRDHIIPQIRKLHDADYGSYLVESFIKDNRNLNKKKLESMLKGNPPNVIIILNRHMFEWIDELKRFNAIVMIVEVFRSRHNSHLLRVNGEFPFIESEIISECYIDPLLNNFLILESPGGLSIKAGEAIDIQYENCLTKWKRLDISDKVFLTPINKNPLLEKVKYKLILLNDNSYSFLRI